MKEEEDFAELWRGKLSPKPSAKQTERKRGLEREEDTGFALQPRLGNKAYVASSDSVWIYSIIKIYMAIWNKLFLT